MMTDGHGKVMSQDKEHMGTQFSLHKIRLSKKTHIVVIRLSSTHKPILDGSGLARETLFRLQNIYANLSGILEKLSIRSYGRLH